MCCLFRKKVKSEVKTEESPVIEEKKESVETAEPVECPVAPTAEKSDAMPKCTTKAIGHVPLPGSGGGKGTTVKK